MIAVAATAPAAAAPAAAATTYTVTDLGSLGEGVSDASGINATGQATGHSYLTKLVPTPACPPVYGNTKKTCVEHPWHAFFYSNGQMTDLGTVSGGNFSEGLAINRAGQVAGESSTNKGGEDAFLWNGQKMIDLGGLKPLAGSNSDATGINDAGQVVGSYGNGSTGQAFLYSNGAQNLNTLLPARPTRSRKPPASTTTARSSPTPTLRTRSSATVTAESSQSRLPAKPALRHRPADVSCPHYSSGPGRPVSDRRMRKSCPPGRWRLVGRGGVGPMARSGACGCRTRAWRR